MLDLKYVLANFDEVATKLGRRGGGIDLEPVRRLGEERRSLLQETESLRQKQNAANERMKQLAKQGGDALDAARAELKELSGQIKGLDERLKGLEADLNRALLYLPNIPADSTPDGKSEEDNVVVRSWGEKPRLDFAPKTHDVLGTELGIFDFDRASKLSGARRNP
jgi:seryl-tRNA synthetase